MKSIFSVFSGAIMVTALAVQAQQPAHHWSIVMHGGAGVIARANLTPDAEAAYRASLKRAIAAGANVLDKGGSALDAVEATINILEDDPLFNAGHGAAFSAEGKNELDSAIMDGSNLKAGAVADVTRTRHPISLARAVMEKSPYVMMVGTGADAFAAPHRPGAGRSELLLYRGALAVAGEAVAEGWPPRSAAPCRSAASGTVHSRGPTG